MRENRSSDCKFFLQLFITSSEIYSRATNHVCFVYRLILLQYYPKARVIILIIYKRMTPQSSEMIKYSALKQWTTLLNLKRWQWQVEEHGWGLIKYLLRHIRAERTKDMSVNARRQLQYPDNAANYNRSLHWLSNVLKQKTRQYLPASERTRRTGHPWPQHLSFFN